MLTNFLYDNDCKIGNKTQKSRQGCKGLMVLGQWVGDEGVLIVTVIEKL